MSIGPLSSLAGSVAGSPLAQSKGSDVDKAHQAAGVQQRQAQSDQKAESAAGIGETDGQEHQAAERDADGRRLWEATPHRKEAAEPVSEDDRRSKDATGQSGTQLDLTG